MDEADPHPIRTFKRRPVDAGVSAVAGSFTQVAGAAGASAASHRLSFVLPLATDGTGRDDLDLLRARLLLASLDRFLDRDSLDRLLVVTPARDLEAARRVLGDFAQTLRIEMVDETALCPELARDPATLNLWPRPNTGWVRQQLIKLAAHEHLRTSFYMTLDADVIFVRPFGASALIQDGRAVLATLSAIDLRMLFRPEIAEHEIAVRRHRIKQAEAVLQLQRSTDQSDVWYGETPALLASDLVASMARHLEATWATGWREALLQHLPWTEYALYGLFAEATGGLEQLHRRGGVDAALRLTDSLWRAPADYLAPRDLDRWDVARAFRAEGEGVAVVVQSYLGHAPAEVAARLEGWLLT